MRAKIIAISGIDGCGKTTVIEKLQEELSQKGLPVKYVWLRYNHYLTKPLLLLGRLLGLTWYEPEDSRVGYHEFYRSKVISWLFISFTYIDTLLASVVCVYVPSYIFGKTVICDRWVLDIIVDLGVDTRQPVAMSSLWIRCFLGLVPKKAKCFVIERDSSLVEEVRSEHRLDKNYPRRLELFEKVSRFPVAVPVDNNSSIDRAVQSILNFL